MGWGLAARQYGLARVGRAPAYTPPYAAPFGPAGTRKQELEFLKGQSEYYEGILNDIRKRIGELEAEAEK
jgi:hypothetical protein